MPRHQPNPPPHPHDPMEDPRVPMFDRINFNGTSHRSPHTLTSSHASTPPIAMPMPGSLAWHNSSGPAVGIGRGATGGGYREEEEEEDLSPRGRRRQSITFDPQVKIGGGREMMPLRTERFSSTTDAEQRSCESVFGKLSYGSRPGIRNGSSHERRITAAHKFLMSPPSSLGTENGFSLSPNSGVASPFLEIPTPPDFLGGSFPEGMVCSPSNKDGHAHLLSEKLSSPIAVDSGPSNKSFSGERPRSRHNRRAMRERSPGSYCSNGLSPAGMFLQSFGRRQQQPAEPDSEGQEVGPYVLGKEIGSGGFSCVKEAFAIENGVKVQRAVKIVRKHVYDTDPENDKVQTDFDHEVSLWRYLYHPHVLSLISAFDTPFATFAFMPLCRDGNLFDLMKRRPYRQGLSAQRAQRYSFQLACALRYLHQDMEIVHGDVKLENCLLDMTNDAEAGGNILLCDFGLAKFMNNPHDGDDSGPAQLFEERPAEDESHTYCITGSLPYSSPEMLHRSTADDPCSPMVDIWAFAVVVFTLLTGSLPFNHSLPQKLASMIVEGVWDVEKLRNSLGLVDAGKAETEKVVQVVKGGLCTDISSRWNIHDVIESTWFEDCASDGSC